MKLLIIHSILFVITFLSSFHAPLKADAIFPHTQFVLSSDLVPRELASFIEKKTHPAVDFFIIKKNGTIEKNYSFSKNIQSFAVYFTKDMLKSSALMKGMVKNTIEILLFDPKNMKSGIISSISILMEEELKSIQSKKFIIKGPNDLKNTSGDFAIIPLYMGLSAVLDNPKELLKNSWFGAGGKLTLTNQSPKEPKKVTINTEKGNVVFYNNLLHIEIDTDLINPFAKKAKKQLKSSFQIEALSPSNKDANNIISSLLKNYKLRSVSESKE